MNQTEAGSPARRHDKYERLIALTRENPAIPTAVAHPCDEFSLRGAVEAAEAGIIVPILVGPAEKIRAVAEKAGLNIAPYEIVEAPHSHDAAAEAVNLVRTGRAELLMKGSLHTDELMGEVMKRDTGLRTGRRVSHAFIMDVPTYPKPLVITDAAINIQPTLEDKVDIVQNAIDLVRALGIEQPKVAILSAVETVTPKIPSTIEAAALCKMAQRGQITGGLLEGPLALDNAISPEAARIKGIDLARGGSCRHPGRSRPGSRQHAGEEPDLPGQRRRRRHRPGRPRADRPDQQGRQRDDAHGVLRRGGPLRPSPAPRKPDKGMTTMPETILVANAGSSSIKFQLFDIVDETGGDTLDLNLKGQVEGIGTHPRLIARDARGEIVAHETFSAADLPDARAALGHLGSWLRARLGGAFPVAVGHRVVHGGPAYDTHVAVDDDVLAKLEVLVPLAPLHQPNNLLPIRAIRAMQPEVLQVACFDTAFHRGHPEVADRYAIPEQLYQDGVRRYGFHGLSYEYITRTLPTVAPEIAGGRLVVAHLGSGASMCAIRDGRSIDSTMGFTALDGLPMGTRPGQLDAGVILHLLTNNGMTADAIQHMLYHDCGLKGLSGISNDVRDLLASDDPRAKLALDYFVYRASLALGSLAASLEGLDAVVFTAGIGENSPAIRAAICQRARWLGIELDETANAEGARLISTGASRVRVYVIPTDEERMIAHHTLEILEKAAPR